MFFDGLQFIFSKLFFFIGSVSNKGSFPKQLSGEDEKKYLEQYKKGDRAARDILITHNLRLVAHIAKKYKDSYEIDDLISVGTIGLIKAINTFEYDKGTQLATFASRCIENEILMLLRSTKKYKSTVSLSEMIGSDKDGNELSLMDLLSDDGDSVLEQVELNIFSQKFIELIRKCLGDREFKIIVLRYGLQGTIPLSQREVAKLMQISRSYISRIEKSAIEKIRCALKNKNFF